MSSSTWWGLEVWESWSLWGALAPVGYRATGAPGDEGGDEAPPCSDGGIAENGFRQGVVVWMVGAGAGEFKCGCDTLVLGRAEFRPQVQGALRTGQGDQGRDGEGSFAGGSSGHLEVTRVPTLLLSVPLWVRGDAELGLQVGSTSPTGFLEKNRDVLSTDILTLVYSSKNKFLREIFKLESAETKLGHGTIIRAKAGSQLFKVGSHGCPARAFWVSQPLGPRGSDVHAQRPITWGLSCLSRGQKGV